MTGHVGDSPRVFRLSFRFPVNSRIIAHTLYPRVIRTVGLFGLNCGVFIRQNVDWQIVEVFRAVIVEDDSSDLHIIVANDAFKLVPCCCIKYALRLLQMLVIGDGPAWLSSARK